MEKKLTTESFTSHVEVEKILKELNEQYPIQNPLVISDVLDGEGNQYVDLVQEGGGVLGIALVGYTYILEEMGIRFYSLAGTSAGAINTILMAGIGNKEDKKSKAILGHLSLTNFFDFVDGNGIVKFFLKSFISVKDYGKRIKNSFLLLISILSLSSIFLAVSVLMVDINLLKIILSLVLFGSYIIAITLIIFFVSKINLFKKYGFGLNPGRVFTKWIKDILDAEQVFTIDQLCKKINTPASNLHLRKGRNENHEMIGSLTIVTCDITTQIKVELPAMGDLYYVKPGEVHPSELVRASMSIPIFFKPFNIKIPHSNTPELKEIWKTKLNYSGIIPNQVYLVDGGMISNFPINVFFNDKIRMPRMPTLGILLDDVNLKLESEITSLGMFLSKLLSTIRSHNDKDFQIKHNDFEKTIGKIDVRGYNWLNFSIKDQEKIGLFIKGAEAARDFLLKFNWVEYKNERAQLFDLRNSEHKKTPEISGVQPLITKNENYRINGSTIAKT